MATVVNYGEMQHKCEPSYYHSIVVVQFHGVYEKHYGLVRVYLGFVLLLLLNHLYNPHAKCLLELTC